MNKEYANLDSRVKTFYSNKIYTLINYGRLQYKIINVWHLRTRIRWFQPTQIQIFWEAHQAIFVLKQIFMEKKISLTPWTARTFFFLIFLKGTAARTF